MKKQLLTRHLSFGVDGGDILHSRILIESDERWWMFMDKHDSIVNYAGDAQPLPKETFSQPRSNGTFAKIVRSQVRERKLMTMQEALRKMCMMSARTLEGFVPQMKKKGRLQKGMDADMVGFDPATIRDVGTYEKPNRPAVGVQSLLVNGTLVVADGKLNVDAAPGRPIRRKAQSGQKEKMMITIFQRSECMDLMI